MQAKIPVEKEIAATQTKPASAGSIESAQADESFYSPRLLVCGRFANTGCSHSNIL